MALKGMENVKEALGQEKAKKARQTKDERIATLKEKKKQIQARIAKLSATDKQKERKQDARRKIILGGILLNLIKSDETLKAKVKTALDTNAEKDKALFADF